jgi:hypothetical protein
MNVRIAPAVEAFGDESEVCIGRHVVVEDSMTILAGLVERSHSVGKG